MRLIFKSDAKVQLFFMLASFFAGILLKKDVFSCMSHFFREKGVKPNNN